VLVTRRPQTQLFNIGFELSPARKTGSSAPVRRKERSIIIYRPAAGRRRTQSGRRRRRRNFARQRFKYRKISNKRRRRPGVGEASERGPSPASAEGAANLSPGEKLMRAPTARIYTRHRRKLARATAPARKLRCDAARRGASDNKRLIGSHICECDPSNSAIAMTSSDSS